MRKFFMIFLTFAFVAKLAAQDPCEGYWLSFDEKTNEITAGWKFYINEHGDMEGIIVYSPGCDIGTIADGCRNLQRDKEFPVSGEFSKMKVMYEIPWIYNLKKNKRRHLRKRVYN